MSFTTRHYRIDGPLLVAVNEPDLSPGELSLCLICVDLRGWHSDKEHRCKCLPRDEKWREAMWGRADIAAAIDLCHLCARGVMKSGSRYTWFVCDSCLEVNRTVGSVLGSPRCGALPVGRHSLMNGVTVGVSSDDSELNNFVSQLRSLRSVWNELFDWRDKEVTRLTEGSGLDGESIHLSEWMRLHPVSTGASVDAFCRFVNYDLPDVPQLRDLSAEREAFLIS